MMSDQETGRERLNRLWQNGTDFLGCPFAVLGGAMTWVSERHLVAAISNAGGFGVLACGAMTPDLLAAEIKGTKDKTKKPFGVNLIVMHPELDALIASASNTKSAISCSPAACRARRPWPR